MSISLPKSHLRLCTWRPSRPRLAALAIALLVATSSSASARADEDRLSLPRGATSPLPLLVMLHGDGQSAARMHEAWAPLANKRGIATLALACPTALGCRGSFWRWNGDSAFLDAAIAKAGREANLDRERTWLVGWSGGASYIGGRAQEIGPKFAAIVLHGGGMPPANPECGLSPAPVYFLEGDKNPLHGLAVRLRDWHLGCGTDVTWDLVYGADHAGEWAALKKRAPAILDWLAAHAPAKDDEAP